MTEVATQLFPNKKRTLPVIKQAQFSECGHACVAMISNYYGHRLDLYGVRKIEEPSMSGSSMLDLVRLFDHLQLNARAIKVEINDLHLVQCPAILHWNMNHFVVLKSVGSAYAIIHDPASGKRKVSFKELSESFTGILLEVEKSSDFNVINDTNTIRFIDLLRNIHGLKTNLSILLVLSVAIELFVLLNPLFLQYIIDNIAHTNHLNNLYIIAAGFIILTLCHTLTEYMRSHFVMYLTNRISEYFSSGVMNHLLRVPFGYFEKRHKGDILSRFHSINDIQSKITNDSINTLLDGVVIVLALMIMSLYNAQLTAMVTLALVLYLTLRALSYHYLKNQTERSVEEHANVNSRFLEIIQSILPIKLYAKESSLYQDWKNLFIKAMNADIKITKANILYTTANLFLSNIEHIMVVTIGALLVLQNHFSVGMLIAFLAYRQILVNKSTSFIQKIFDYKLMSVHIDRVTDILIQPAEAEKSIPRIKKIINGDLKVQNLHYKYSENQPWILHNISFHIHQGEKVAIVGPSGIGKTTLLKIMLGLIPPTHGNILIDDIAIEFVGYKAYRAACSSVMQNDTLISGSILDNITFMDTKIDIDKVYQVTKIASIHEDIIAMPMSYETLIGDMGSTLSGGQKQRILIARALYKNPKILFLDEATSHLDMDTEIKINATLQQLNITQIIIAHREESIKMADRLITLTKPGAGAKLDFS